MEKTVGKRFGHLKGYRFVGYTVTCRDNDAVVRKLMLTNNAVKRDLVGRRLHRLRRGRDLIEEKDVYDVFAIVHLKDLRLEPYCKRFICVGCRNSAQVDGIEEEKSNVCDPYGLARLLFDLLCNLSHTLRFTHTGRSPEHNRGQNFRRNIIFNDRAIRSFKDVDHSFNGKCRHIVTHDAFLSNPNSLSIFSI